MRLVDMRHRRLHLRIGADDHAITNARAMRRSAIYRDDAGAGLGTDRIRRETLAVGDVVDLALFVLQDVGAFEQLGIARAGTFEVEFSVGQIGSASCGDRLGTDDYIWVVDVPLKK